MLAKQVLSVSARRPLSLGCRSLAANLADPFEQFHTGTGTHVSSDVQMAGGEAYINASNARIGEIKDFSEWMAKRQAHMEASKASWAADKRGQATVFGAVSPSATENWETDDPVEHSYYFPKYSEKMQLHFEEINYKHSGLRLEQIGWTGKKVNFTIVCCFIMFGFAGRVVAEDATTGEGLPEF